MTEEKKYPYLDEGIKEIYLDALKKLQSGECSLEPLLNVFYDHLNDKCKEIDKLNKLLNEKKTRIEFLESYLTAVSSAYLEKFPEDERERVTKDLTDKLLSRYQ